MIQEVKTFGYKSNDDVKGQYDSCMMKGEVEVICKLMCSKISTIDHGNDHESDNQCDKCRGSPGIHKFWVVKNEIFTRLP